MQAFHPAFSTWLTATGIFWSIVPNNCFIVPSWPSCFFRYQFLASHPDPSFSSLRNFIAQSLYSFAYFINCFCSPMSDIFGNLINYLAYHNTLVAFNPLHTLLFFCRVVHNFHYLRTNNVGLKIQFIANTSYFRLSRQLISNILSNPTDQNQNGAHHSRTAIRRHKR